MDLRQEKGKQIAQTRQIKKLEDGFAVQSQTAKRFYFVNDKGQCIVLTVKRMALTSASTLSQYSTTFKKSPQPRKACKLKLNTLLIRKLGQLTINRRKLKSQGF